MGSKPAVGNSESRIAAPPSLESDAIEFLNLGRGKFISPCALLSAVQFCPKLSPTRLRLISN